MSDDCTSPTATNEFSIQVWGTYVPSFHANKKQGCIPQTINFYQDVQNHDEGTSYLWRFGDESTSVISFDDTPSHIFTSPGTYNISLEITTPKGCKSIKTEYNYITTYPIPIARFESKPQVTSTIKPVIYFENYSVGATAWHWDFGNGDSTFAWNVEHVYPDYSSDYFVQLVAISNYGCMDTIESKVRIIDEVTFHIPTGFSPDGDGTNEIFRPYGNAISEEDYLMQIYDRWGEIVFESTDFNKGWDGSIKGNKKGQSGTYSYVIRFVDTFNVPHERSGSVTLIK